MKKEMTKSLSSIARTIKDSLAMVIPILFIGSFTVLLTSLPSMTYQNFMSSFMDGALMIIVVMIQKSTVGCLAIYITVALNFSYMKRHEQTSRPVYHFGSLLGCLTGFSILVGLFSGEPDFTLLSGQGVFSALVAGIAGSVLFRKFDSYFNTRKTIYVDGADSEFNSALHMILPCLCVTLTFAVVNYLVNVIFGVQSLQHLFMNVMDAVFMKMHRSYSSGLLFTTLASIMWWFGIHGNNVLNQVAEDMFVTIIPGEIVSKSFIDVYVNMGGTGCTIGLLIAMMIFGKRNSTKKLSRMAVVPGIFNIGELMVFGFPIIYNPPMIIPFVLAPVFCFTNAYIMTKVGFVPTVDTSVVWTIPPLFSGYLATGSYRAVLLQIVNIIISVVCYAPFVVISERKSLDEFSSAVNTLVLMLKKKEETGEEVILTECEGNVGRIAKTLAMDLETSLGASAPGSEAVTENPLMIYYQPQYDNDGVCIGAESLLRWKHKQCGIVYPPLVVQIAKESGNIYKFETNIIERAIMDSESLRKRFGDKFKLSVNVTVPTLTDKRFISFLQTMAVRYKLKTGNICLEITEETELVNSKEIGDLIREIRSFGYLFALDDFSMGHTSLQYLQHNHFDIVKLDGNLVKSVLDNERTKEIISSIVFLSKSLDFKVVAEFVETVEQREALKGIGCHIYQGYLYSPAVPMDSLISEK